MRPGRPNEPLSPGGKKSRRPPITPTAQEMLPARGGGLTAPTLPEPPASHVTQPAPSGPPGLTPPPSTQLSSAASVWLRPAVTHSPPCASIGWSRRSPRAQ